MSDPARRPASSAEPDVATAVVTDGALSSGSLADPPVPWWSFAKTVLAAAALVLVDAGRLSLDAVLPGRRYTLRQLLQHRTGLPDYGWLKSYHEAVARRDEPWSVEALLERVSALRSGEPGGIFLYSNVGYLFVRQLIEETAAEPIGAAVERLVLAPLEVAGASFATTPEHLAATRWGNPRGYDPGWVYHGLMIGPPAAAALLLDRLLTGKLLLPASLRAMQDAYRLDVEIDPDRPWRGPSYGLGLMIDAAEGARLVGHSGAGPWSTSAVYHFPGRTPAVTAAAFAPLTREALVENRVVEIARGLQGSR